MRGSEGNDSFEKQLRDGGNVVVEGVEDMVEDGQTAKPQQNVCLHRCSRPLSSIVKFLNMLVLEDGITVVKVVRLGIV